MTTANERAFAFHWLERGDPGNHLLDCPDAVVIRGDGVADESSLDGADMVEQTWAIQCGHGTHATKLTVHALVERR